MTVLSQVNDLDDQVFNTLPPQPAKKKDGSPSKQKQGGSGEKSGQAQPQVSEKSDKALFIEAHQDHTPEQAGVWAEIMKLPGTKRSNQVADGYVQWLSKNYNCIIHEVNTYLFVNYSIIIYLV